jgi:hypothetical protein
MHPTLSRGAQTSAFPASTASLLGFNQAPPAPFTISTPPGSSYPTTDFASVPGLTGLTPGAPIPGVAGIPSVNRTSDSPSQQVIVQAHIIRNWGVTAYDTKIGRGQAVFLNRNMRHGEEKDIKMIVTLPQINEILRKSFQKGRMAGITDRNIKNLDSDRLVQLYDVVADDLRDDLDRQRAALDDSRKGAQQKEAYITKLARTQERWWFSDEKQREFIQDHVNQYMQYLNIFGITNNWNHIGFVRNIEPAGDTLKIANVAVRGPLDVDNYWGSSVQQSLYTYLILTRGLDASGEYTHFEFRPWIEQPSEWGQRRQFYTKFPSAAELEYTDFSGAVAYGRTLQLGKVSRVLGTSTPQFSRDESSARLGGRADDSRAEEDAWRETISPNKSTVFLTIGADPWFKGL